MSWMTQIRNSNNRFGSIAIGLHWAMLLLLVAVYACMELREFYPKGSDPREAMKAWHYMLGISVLLLVIARIAWRLANVSPQIQPAPPRWQALAGRGMHLLLYAFLLGMPIVGWLLLSAKGEAVSLFGMALPALTGKNEGLADSVLEVHETVATIGYFLVGFHSLAALFHHYVSHDNTLRRMLPG